MKLRHVYYVYILQCADGSYYTGMTNSMDRRLAEHEKGLIPTCYTYNRRPVVLKYCQDFQYVNDAIRREKQIQKWSRKKKEALINGDFEELMRLAKGPSAGSG
jgi:putative endonuclease